MTCPVCEVPGCQRFFFPLTDFVGDDLATEKWQRRQHRAVMRDEHFTEAPPKTAAERAIDQEVLRLRMKFPRDPFWVELQERRAEC